MSDEFDDVGEKVVMPGRENDKERAENKASEADLGICAVSDQVEITRQPLKIPPDRFIKSQVLN